ncbi:hypothetical protein CYY_006766 [Polysphondylium violaceum]|uniref:FNIP repeat-containing protein n=1 Tax=Polysphondylium violaceum TaxID=133409 RepID=A0A8J4V5H0_9MYCE|nr:hypothetical protein CYY_006766 [Polysphondylium violaceum]
MMDTLGSNNITNNSNNNNLFYSVWRNIFLRDLVRVKVFVNTKKRISFDDLETNNPLVSLTNEDKLKHNIFLESFIFDQEDFENYVKNPYRHVLNSIHFNSSVYTPPQQYDDEEEEAQEQEEEQGGVEEIKELDLQCIHQGVHCVSFDIKTNSKPCQGFLPDSVTQVSISEMDGECNTQFINSIIHSLPSGLKSLSIPEEYKFTSPYVMNDTLHTLQYRSTHDSMQWLVRSPNKVLDACTLEIKAKEEYAWLGNNKWITSAAVIRSMGDLCSNIVPQHVVKLSIEYDDAVIQPDAFPKKLELLKCTHPIRFDKNVLPYSNLTHITLKYYFEKLEKDILPCSLEHLKIGHFEQPLDQVGVFPQGLKTLVLKKFDHPFHPFVLPQGLQILNMPHFKQPFIQANVLPPSLLHLEMQLFSGSFESGSAPLDNLQLLTVDALDASISLLLTNVVKLRIWTLNGFKKGTSLYNTSIQDLFLYSYERVSVNQSSLPQHLKKFRADGLDIDQ